jgi:hypothetical protein
MTNASLVQTAEHLTAMIERETEVLRSPEPGSIASLQEEKSRLAALWTEGLTRLGSVEALSETERKTLGAAARRLDDALLRNERILRAVTIATDRVISAIADAVRDQRSCGVGYGMRRQAPRTRAPASGISVDRKL